jgi:hypothetical protein
MSVDCYQEINESAGGLGMFGHEEFFHATTLSQYQQMQSAGYIAADSYFAVREIADYYASCIVDEGDEPVILCIPASAFDEPSMAIDRNGIDEPVTYTAFGLTEDDVHSMWDESDKTVEACVDLIGSFKYRSRIAIEFVSVCHE